MLTGIALAVSAVVTVPIGFLVLEILMAKGSADSVPVPVSLPQIPSNGDGHAELRAVARRPSVAVLVPAHNEEAVIEQTLKSVMPQLSTHDRLLVVADNCTDKTAEVAKTIGAEVIVRSDSIRRGKGFALAHGVAHLNQAPTDVLLICDADAIMVGGSLEKLARTADELHQPVQAKYLLKADWTKSAKTRVSAFAFLVKNFVRPSGLQRLGGSCLLTGTGMAFPWALIKDASFGGDNLVEDMQLGIDLAIAGAGPVLCAEALVYSESAPDTAAVEQRTRWEHGHLNTIRTQSVRLFREAFKQKRWDLFVLGLEVSVPPLAMLVMVYCGLLGLLAALHQVVLIPSWVLVAYSLLGGIFAGAIVLAWYRHGRAYIRGSDLLTIPLYIVGKFAIYLRFFYRPQKSWVRTDRDAQSKEAAGAESED